MVPDPVFNVSPLNSGQEFSISPIMLATWLFFPHRDTVSLIVLPSVSKVLRSHPDKHFSPTPTCLLHMHQSCVWQMEGGTMRLPSRTFHGEQICQHSWNNFFKRFICLLFLCMYVCPIEFKSTIYLKVPLEAIRSIRSLWNWSYRAHEVACGHEAWVLCKGNKCF